MMKKKLHKKMQMLLKKMVKKMQMFLKKMMKKMKKILVKGFLMDLKFNYLKYVKTNLQRKN